MFKDSVYINRRNQLRKDVGSGIILLPGNDESPMNYADNTYHFRQDSTFLYFFGINRPGLMLFWILTRELILFMVMILRLRILSGWENSQQ